MFGKDLNEIHNKLMNKEIQINELINETNSNLKKIQKKLKPLVTIIEEPKKSSLSENMLSCIPYISKDNISTKNILTTASSNTLNNYVPFYDATVIERLNNCNAILVGKSSMDELGMGGTGTTAHTGVVKNPWDPTRITGGSSAGSACIVASGIIPYALGSDTGDSIRKPAAYCGIVGYKPTYGAISRYGLFPFASSLDHIGVLTRNVLDAAMVVENVLGIDERDMTSIDLKKDLTKDINKEVKGKKLFYIKNLIDTKNYQNPNKELLSIIEQFKNTIEKSKELGMIVEGIDFDEKLLNAIYPTYLCISCAEATSNDSNLTGIIFGPRGEGNNYIEMMKNHRTKGFSSLIKRRFIIGSFVLQRENQEKYFLNAKRVRRLIVEKMNELFENYDALIMPASGTIAPKIDMIQETIDNKMQVLENYMAIANFGGFPSITIPNGFVENMPIGINITGKVMDDKNVLNIANKIESKMEYKNQYAKEWLK